MDRPSVLLLLILVVRLLAEVESLNVNISLTPFNLVKYQAEHNALMVTIPTIISLNCKTSSDKLVVNVNKDQYDNCLQPLQTNYDMGHCANSPLHLTVSTIDSPLVVQYEVGKYFYFVVYGSNGETTYCEQGYKFIVYVTDSIPVATSSTIIPSSSIAISSSLIPEISPFESDVSSTSSYITYTTTSLRTYTTTVMTHSTETTYEINPTNIPSIVPTNVLVYLEGVKSGTVTTYSLPSILCVILCLTVNLFLLSRII